MTTVERLKLCVETLKGYGFIGDDGQQAIRELDAWVSKLIPESASAIDLIFSERIRQIEQEHWTFNHDDGHTNSELARAAACYAMGIKFRYVKDGSSTLHFAWPWDGEWWKPSPNDRIRELVKAGALIAAEIDRLQRIQNQNFEWRTPTDEDARQRPMAHFRDDDDESWVQFNLVYVTSDKRFFANNLCDWHQCRVRYRDGKLLVDWES